MTPTDRAARLAAIRERIAQATPGPWDIDVVDGSVFSEHVPPDGLGDAGGGYTVVEDCAIAHDPDKSLIAHAPADLRWLMGEVERLEAIKDAAREMHTYELEGGPEYTEWHIYYDALYRALEAHDGD